MTNAKNFVDFAVASAFVNAPQDYVGKGAVIELLRKAWEDKIIDETDLITYCWNYKVSTRYFGCIHLKTIITKKINSMGIYPRNAVKEVFDCDDDSADRVVYGLSRSYVNNDILIELIHGMHKDILRGEVESAVLS